MNGRNSPSCGPMRCPEKGCCGSQCQAFLNRKKFIEILFHLILSQFCQEDSNRISVARDQRACARAQRNF